MDLEKRRQRKYMKEREREEETQTHHLPGPKVSIPQNKKFSSVSGGHNLDDSSMSQCMKENYFDLRLTCINL